MLTVLGIVTVDRHIAVPKRPVKEGYSTTGRGQMASQECQFLEEAMGLQTGNRKCKCRPKDLLCTLRNEEISEFTLGNKLLEILFSIWSLSGWQ